MAQIRELEAQLDRLIDEASRRDLSELDDDDDDVEEADVTTLRHAALIVPEDDGSDMEITRDASPELVARANAGKANMRESAPRVETVPSDDPPVDRAQAAPQILRTSNVTPASRRGPDATIARPPPSDVPTRPELGGDSPEPPSIPPTPRAPRPQDRLSTRDLAGAAGAKDEATVFDTARELLSSDFYLRKWGRLAMRGRSEEVDDFGFDPIYEEKGRAVLEFLYTRYFRVETTGIQRVPSRGRCLLVANHSGTLPLDGLMLKTAVKLEHSSPRDLRWLTEDFIYHMPYLGSTLNRLGAVRACQENAERLLAKDQLVAVFPEGVKGIGKLFAERYRLQRFGRGGFIKLCLRTQTPIIPVAIVGAEETNPLLFRIEYLSKALGVPYVPVTPTFPLLGPLGLMPAPTKWQIHFGEPVEFGGYRRDDADDELLVGKLAERVRATIQGMLDRAVGSRKSVFFG